MWLRNDAVNILRYLPEFQQKDEDFKAVGDVLSREHDRHRLLLQDIFHQRFVQTATWGLAYWEKEIGLTPRATDTYEQRRNRIMLWWQSNQTSTREFMARLAERYLSNGTAEVMEYPDKSSFNIVLHGDLDKIVLDRRGAKEAIDLYKPAHLIYGIVAFPTWQFTTNRAGDVISTVIPPTTWQETQQHVIFATGTNAAGDTEKRTTTETSTKTYQAGLFTSGRTNGTITTNRAGGYSVNTKDVGGDVTETWNVFSGGRLNSRASPATNNASHELKSRTYHKSDWREIISRGGRNTNGAEWSGKTWTETYTTSRAENAFKRPWFALNNAGTVTVEHMDVGEDIELTETLFKAGTLNGCAAKEKSATVNKTIYTSWQVFTGGRLNGKSMPRTNNAPSTSERIPHTITRQIISSFFSANSLNGTIKTNAGAPREVTHTVHIAKWRDVVHRAGGSTTNCANHTTKTVIIEHTKPGRTEKTFSPKHGTLTNNHAVIGYLRL